MAKTQIKRMDWFKWFPRDIQSSLNYRMLSPTQRGAYRDMLDHCWINFEKGCGIKVDSEWLSNAWNENGWVKTGTQEIEPMISEMVKISDEEVWAKVMPAVFKMFRVQDGLLVNEKLLEQVNETLEVTLAAQQRRLGSTPVEPEPNPSGHSSDPSSGTGLRQVDKKQIREETETETENTAVTVGQVFDQTLAESTEGAKNGGRRRGVPGYFQRGQYPGTSPKAIFSHISKAWSRIRGESAVCRYPSKYPENWELLCDAKSGDLLVPAFELWAVKEGFNTEWPLTEFIKVAQKYMEQVIPLKEAKPKVTPQVVEASRVAALAADMKLWDSTEVKTKEPGPEEF